MNQGRKEMKRVLIPVDDTNGSLAVLSIRHADVLNGRERYAIR